MTVIESANIGSRKMDSDAITDLKRLYRAIAATKFYPGETSKPAVELNFGEHVVRMQCLIVNRKCYDGMPTPTLQVKLNGKRIAYKTLFKLFDVNGTFCAE
jgi:hypothetical protein